MNREEQQAYNDGRCAFRDGRKCSRRSVEQRAAWQAGYEHERRLNVAETATDEQRVDAATAVAKLKAFAHAMNTLRSDDIFPALGRVALSYKGNGQYLCVEPPFVLRSGATFGGAWSSVDRLQDADTWASRNGAAFAAKRLGITSQHWEIVPC